MAQHNLKTIPPYFQSVWDGEKPFELLKADRPFMVGDLLVLEEYIPETKEYTKRKICVTISYVLQGFKGLCDGYCIVGIINQDNYE